MTISEVYGEAGKMTEAERITAWTICCSGRDKHQVAGLEETYPLGSYYCDRCWTVSDSTTKRPRNEPKMPPLYR